MVSMEEKGTVFEISPVEKQVPASKSKGSRKRHITIFIGVSLLNIALLVFLWTQLLIFVQNAAQGQSRANDPFVGHRAPDFTLDALSLHPAASISLASFKKKPVMLNV